jgi:hypothetical protein
MIGLTQEPTVNPWLQGHRTDFQAPRRQTTLSSRLWYGDANAVANAIGYAQHFSRSHDAVIRVYDEAGNVIETHEHKGDFKEW